MAYLPQTAEEEERAFEIMKVARRQRILALVEAARGGA